MGERVENEVLRTEFTLAGRRGTSIRNTSGKVCRRAEGKSDVEMVQWIKVLAASLDKLSLLQGRRGEAAPMSCLLTSADGLRHTFRK